MAATDREFDMVVHGVTGVTGWEVAREAARVLGPSGRLGVAGRREAAVEACVEKLRKEFPGVEIGAMVADCGDAESLSAMAARTRIVLACCGPFRLLGYPVALACAKNGTHYADITGEPQFSESLEGDVHSTAVANGCTLVTCAGFDSVPADLGVLFAKRSFLEEFGDEAVPVSVVSSLSLSAGEAGVAVNTATYESAVHGFGSVNDLKRVRREAAARLPDWGRPGAVSVGPKPKSQGGLQREPRALGSRLAMPFPGSDASVVRRSQAAIWRRAAEGAGVGALVARGKSSEGAVREVIVGIPRDCVPVHHSCLVSLPSWWVAALTFIAGFVLWALAQWEWGRRLLIAAPGLFTFGMFKKGGPTEEQKAGTSFEIRLALAGCKPGPAASGLLEAATVRGSRDKAAPRPSLPKPDAAVMTVVQGKEPGYVATPACIVAVAACVLHHAGRTTASGDHVIPAGVYTPAAALAGTDIFKRLDDAGVRFRSLGKVAVTDATQ